METAEIKNESFTETGLKKFDSEIKREDLEKLAKDCRGLTIAGVDDKVGFETVSNARKSLKAKRVLIEKTGKAIREEANAFVKQVITKEKELIGIISPVEDDLQAKEDFITNEKARIKKEKEDAERVKIEDRINKLRAFNYEIDYPKVATMTDEDFKTTLAEAEKEFQVAEQAKEAARIKAEQEAKAEAEKQEKIRQEQAAEAARLEKIRLEQEEKERAFKAELDRVAKEQAAALEKIRLENERIEREKKAIEDEKIRVEQERIRAIELEKEKKLAAERAVKEAEEKRRLEAELKAKKEAWQKAEAERLEALKPDKEKIVAFANSLKTLSAPQLQDEKAQMILAHHIEEIFEIANNLIQDSENL